MNRILSVSLFVCVFSFSIEAREGTALKVLVVTGVHKYDKAAFGRMFDSFGGMECSIQEMGKDPGALFENIEEFSYDAIVLYNFRQTLSAGHRENFEALLDRGVGLTVLHHAIAGFPGWLEYEEIIGATYVLQEETRQGRHYPRPKWKHGVDMRIKVEDAGHPVTRGVEDFTIHDETYKLWVFHEGNHLLLSTENERSNAQIAWTRPHPKTRVFFLQLGHDGKAFGNDSFRRLVSQGIAWTAGAADGQED